jgi:hypothetical protein
MILGYQSRRLLLLPLFLFFVFLNSATAHGEGGTINQARQAKNWTSFEAAMENLRSEEETTGRSYVISGALVTLGSAIGGQQSTDAMSKLVYGLAEGIGVASIGYGVGKINYGTEFDSFFESLREAPLTMEQKNHIVEAYLERERQRRLSLRHVTAWSYFALGALNIYSAATEHDHTAKTFLGFLAGVNLALGFAYSF